MSISIPVQNTADKILNSDIYDLTAFVDDIKKTVIDGVSWLRVYFTSSELYSRSI